MYTEDLIRANMSREDQIQQESLLKAGSKGAPKQMFKNLLNKYFKIKIL
jgi:hypothetical protein